jgi:hypothetical protein
MSVGGFNYDSKRVHTREKIQRHSNTVFKDSLLQEKNNHYTYGEFFIEATLTIETRANLYITKIK